MLEAALPHVCRSDGVGHSADHSSSLNFAGRGIQATALLRRLVRQVGRLFATSRVVLLHIELLGAVEGAVWHMIASSSHMTSRRADQVGLHLVDLVVVMLRDELLVQKLSIVVDQVGRKVVRSMDEALQSRRQG